MVISTKTELALNDRLLDILELIHMNVLLEAIEYLMQLLIYEIPDLMVLFMQKHLTNVLIEKEAVLVSELLKINVLIALQILRIQHTFLSLK